MSTEAQLPIPLNEGTSDGPHTNLGPMAIMQELKRMKKDITNLSLEHRGRSNNEGDVTPNTQWGYRSYNSHVPYDSPAQSTHQFHDSGRHTTRDGKRGGLGGRE